MPMDRTITVTGSGKASCSPNFVSISLVIDGKDKKYARAVELAEAQHRRLNEGLLAVGFEADAAKTTGFNVSENRVPDRQHNWKSDGYVCVHRVCIEFDFDPERLARALAVVTSGVADPRLQVEFKLKDPMTLQEQALLEAGRNARRKAEALCAAVGASLGQLVSVENGGGHFPETFAAPKAMPVNPQMLAAGAAAPAVEVQPEDITVSASATYVWEIV